MNKHHIRLKSILSNKSIKRISNWGVNNPKVTDLVEVFANQTGLQRNQVEKEVMQLLQQLRDGGLIAIAGQPDQPNVEFKK